LELWAILLPLIVGSALPPMQTLITVLLLGRPGGRSAALAWVGGMTAVRLAQGLLFGAIFEAATEDAGEPGEPGPILAGLLLVVALLLYASAAKQLLRDDAEDDEPPRWLTAIESLTPSRAFLAGGLLMLVGVKFWVFTLSALAAIAEASLGQPGAAFAYLAFVVLAQGIHLAILGFAMVAPVRSAASLGRLAAFLRDSSRPIMIVFGVVFGTWFLFKALQGFGLV
jgi:threonine/homoserine/homoserine lactone efflux protein